MKIVAPSFALLFLSVSQSIAEEMTFTLSGNGGNCVGCEWVAAEGEITPKTPDKFRQYLSDSGDV